MEPACIMTVGFADRLRDLLMQVLKRVGATFMSAI